MVNEANSGNFFGSRSRDRGKGSFRSRGGKRNTDFSSDFDYSPKKARNSQQFSERGSKPQCSHCNKLGHTEDNCWSKNESERPNSSRGFRSANNMRGGRGGRGGGKFGRGQNVQSKFVCRKCGHNEAECEGQLQDLVAESTEPIKTMKYESGDDGSEMPVSKLLVRKKKTQITTAGSDNESEDDEDNEEEETEENGANEQVEEEEEEEDEDLDEEEDEDEEEDDDDDEGDHDDAIGNK